MDLFSSLVQVARGQIDELIHVIVDDEDVQVDETQSTSSCRKQRLTSKSGGELKGENSRDTSGEKQSKDKDKTKHAVAKEEGSGDTVSYRKTPIEEQENLVFVQNLMKDQVYAKQLFMSYSRVLLRKGEDPFDMSPEQNTHARHIIQAVPAFNQLRFELCPSQMQDGRFWRVYFSILDDKSSQGASKEIESDIEDRISSSKLSGDLLADFAKGASLSEAKEEVITEEDKCKGLKRERDDEAGASDAQPLSEDLAVVSRLFYEGACKTLEYAGQLIEAVDEQANSAMSSEPVVSPSTSTDIKRGRFDRLVSTENEGLVPDSETPCETDSFSVSSVEEDGDDLKDWSCVRASGDERGALDLESYEII